MHAYLYASGVLLHPFDDAAPAWRVLDRPLAELQDEALRACGLTPIRVESHDAANDPEPFIVLSDALYFTAEGMQAFLDAARTRGSHAQAVIAPGAYADRVLWHLPNDAQGVRLPLYYVAGPAAGEPVPLAIDLVDEMLPVRSPAHMGGGAGGPGLEQVVTARAFVPIASWVNLWQANVQGLMAKVAHAKTLPWWKSLPVFILGRGNLYRMMGKLNRIGKNCRIHPTAVVELSDIGDDVEIGAYAVVRMSVVGNGALIDDHAVVRACVIGAGASVANNNNVLLCVAYPRAFIISGPYQFSLFGSDCAIMHCICCDTRLDAKPIKADDGTPEGLRTPLRYLGSCYGHRVRAGAGTITAPGRAIPNDTFFLPPPDAVVSQVPLDLPKSTNLVTRDGTISRPAPRA